MACAHAAAAMFTRDVEVTRRLYRSGESEYLIDGEVCRLRDVHELLMDTGLGAKAYAIIEQGKIGMILSSRPADRRQLIEEAAGITKYKSRRRAAELKLEAAQQNLTRIDDIVFEVEKQRGALKRQAAKARRYKRLREELRRWEKVLFVAPLPRAGADDRRRRRRGWPRRESARRRLRPASPRWRPIRRACASSRRRPIAVRRGFARRLTRESSTSTAVSSSRNSTGITSRCWRRGGDEITAELRELEAQPRTGAARAWPNERRAADEAGACARRGGGGAGRGDEAARASAQQQIEGLEADVEAARSSVFAALNCRNGASPCDGARGGAARAGVGERSASWTSSRTT